MQHIVRNLMLIGLVLAICLLSLYPPEENLRKGKDLAGGVSLVYTVDVQPDDPPDILERTIEVLKERINPNGLYEISFTPVGRNRIEITMPLPGDQVTSLRSHYESALNDLAGFELDPAAFARAMRMDGQARVDALDALATSPALESLLRPVREPAARIAELRAEYEAAKASGNQAEVERLAPEINNFTEVMEAARSSVAQSIVTRDQVRAALAQSNESVSIYDAKARKPVVLGSVRDRALKSVGERIAAFPGGQGALDNVVAEFGKYEAKREGFDDDSELQRLLQGSGVLEFRIAPRAGRLADEQRLRTEFRETGRAPEGYTWAPLKALADWVDNFEEWEAVQADPEGYFAGTTLDSQGNAMGPAMVVEERDGQFYLLLHDAPGERLTRAEGEWSVARSYPATDQLGRAAIEFRMDPRGANLLGALTDNNLQEMMAILLDGRVYTAANINSKIMSRGIIQGTFAPEEINYIVRTLNAGALQARLGAAPISVKRLAPTLGADNLEKGLRASWIALAAVSAFMVMYYFMHGVIASISLIVNAVIILGIMSLARAAFTLPGIAGIVLTFGMAVDANVLIYERLREELQAGNDLRIAVRLAFKRAHASIVDSNITNLIVCVVLAYTATQEIRGFAITLGIGVVSTLFTALFVTRVIYTVLIEVFGVRTLRQLPMVVPAIDKLLTPRVDWIRLRPFFLVCSGVLLGTGLFMIASKGSAMLDTEFLGGVKVSLPLAEGQTMTREQVRERIDEIGAEAAARVAADPDDEEARSLLEFTGSRVLVVPIEPEDDGITSDEFELRTVVQNEHAVAEAINLHFRDELGTTPPLEFEGSDLGQIAGAPIFDVTASSLKDVIDDREVIDYDVSDFDGGIAIVLRDLHPQPTVRQVRDRLAAVRGQADHATTALGRRMQVVVLDGSDDAVRSAVVLVHDDGLSALDEAKYLEFNDEEWRIVREALTQSRTLAGVEKFSPAMASSFRAQAAVSLGLSLLLILVYIWIRFGSMRYSLAAIVGLVHDVIAVVGLIALAEVLYENFPVVGAVGIQPFKIDLGLVAALMTIIGYSLNDTIIILDRVRELRGKLPYASRKIVNDAINLTLSRTIITSGTTLTSVLVLFIVGGNGIASFNYALLCGVIVGTYSTLAVAAPMVYSKKASVQGRSQFGAPARESQGELASV